MPNQLSGESSPYLLQHANNPVHWQPWGEPALRQAKLENKPILLSIGYAACHWCHVMEHESFSNTLIAEQMNHHFICIKVDREERPDLDKIYQTAHQILTERPGGWPLTVVLTPDGHAPFFAGTYFPPEPRQGMPGFPDLLEKIAAHYQQNQSQMQGHEASFRRALQQLNPVKSNSVEINAPLILQQSVEKLKSQFDPTNGGFGGAPKFPHPTQIELLLRASVNQNGGSFAESTTQEKSNDDVDLPVLASAMANKTLHKMQQGGLFDQLGGGFFRYSVDKHWRIPHFEKMLYDNAQLISLYTDAYCLNKATSYRATVEKAANWVISEMQQPNGGYASTLDADSEGVEGKYYVWSETDLRAILSSPQYNDIEAYFGLVGEPNFEGKWHFNIADNIEDIAPFSEHQTDLQPALDQLFNYRNERVRPGLDDKILTAWNGLMIKAMANAGRCLALPHLLVSAQNAADFVRTYLWKNDRLLVSYREQQGKLNGYLDDYAFMADGLMALLQTQWRKRDLDFLISLCDAMLQHFEDEEQGGFFFTSHDHEQLLHRPKPGADDAIPSSNGIAASVLHRVGLLLGDSRYMQAAARTIQLFSTEITQNPSVFATLSIAAQDAHHSNRVVVLRGKQESIQNWMSALQQHYRPDLSFYAIPDDGVELPAPLASKVVTTGETIAYICNDHQCEPAVNSLPALEKRLGLN